MILATNLSTNVLFGVVSVTVGGDGSAATHRAAAAGARDVERLGRRAICGWRRLGQGTVTLCMVRAVGPPLRLTTWPVKTRVVEVPAVSVTTRVTW